MYKFLFLLLIFISSDCLSKIDTKPVLKKPNVLFISIDDLRPELGCYGKDYIHSPNIDKLASSGIIFKNHFVQVPTCGASRFSMLTGMLPLNRNHLKNDAFENYTSTQPLTDQPETFIHHLKNNGYYTVGIGKISHSADGLVYGYEEKPSTQKELPYSWNELVFDSGKWKTGWNAFFGYANGENRQSMNRQVKPYEIGNVDDESYPDGLTAKLAIDKLNELANKDTPFFLGVGFFKPHLPFNAPKKYWDLYEEDKIAIAPYPDLPKNINQSSLHNSGEFNGYLLGEEKAKLDKPLSDSYARKIKHAYFASVSYVDAQVGKVLEKLDELGLSESTIVVIWGDHGWHLGDNRTWGKHTLFERSLKSTLIIKAPQVSSKGKTANQIVSSTDLYPTLMELCNVNMPHKTDGNSLVKIIKKPKIIQSKNVSYGYYKNGISLRTEQYRMTKYFRKSQPTIELFDLLKDPYETTNIANENPEIISSLMPILDKGNTGLYNHN
ncbi:sulfatase [Flavivirga rizhaonensis]|uniref:DUF4976 domain-containing protein n=1 Tax=Flavivirga rizhaonensis TaxID=2559571 RepID=A0A4S1E3V0_9FLAO|nr:sulfatase [Flavivirga rizhaonensis]TGV04738.1 DUF4976 domain-containing protein [Flavivirga rizhaonensis]